MPGTPTSVTSCGASSRARALQRVHERSELPLSADERRAQAHRRRRRRSVRAPRRPPRRDTGSALPFAWMGSASRYSIDIPRRAIRGVSDEDAVDRRGRLHPRCGVDDVAGDHRLALGRPRAEGDERLARVHGRAEVEVVDRVANGERRANGALRVVLVCGRSAEHGHDRVADELLDRAAVPLDLVAQPRVVRRKRRADVLGVEPLGAAGEADEVGEENGDDLPLLPRGLRGQRGPAAAAEAEALWILLSALGADDHGHTVRRATALRRGGLRGLEPAPEPPHALPTGGSSSGRIGAPVSRQSWQRSDAKRSSAGARAPPQARQMLFGRASFVTRSTMAARSDGRQELLMKFQAESDKTHVMKFAGVASLCCCAFLALVASPSGRRSRDRDPERECTSRSRRTTTGARW